MKRTVNIYDAIFEGESLGPVRASTKKEAAYKMRCDQDRVICKQANVRRLIDEILIDHIAGHDPVSWKIKTLRSAVDGTKRRKGY